MGIRCNAAVQTGDFDSIIAGGLDSKATVTVRCEPPWRAAPTRGTTMAKGHECPVCGRNTLQAYTTNQLKCTKCDTVVKKDQLS